MSAFEEFEKEVVRVLLRPHMEPEEIAVVLESATQVSFEPTGAGYFLTVRHSCLPKERIVCSEPLLTGTGGDIDCGFVVFLENEELTFECHSWGDTAIPDDFRKREVEVRGAA